MAGRRGIGRFMTTPSICLKQLWLAQNPGALKPREGGCGLKVSVPRFCASQKTGGGLGARPLSFT